MLLLLAIVASYVSLVVGRHGSWLVAEVRVWALAYPLFLLAVVRPITSMWRFLMLDFPIAAIVVSMTVRGADGQRVTLRLAAPAGARDDRPRRRRHRVDRGAADRHPVV